MHLPPTGPLKKEELEAATALPTPELWHPDHVWWRRKALDLGYDREACDAGATLSVCHALYGILGPVGGAQGSRSVGSLSDPCC